MLMFIMILALGGALGMFFFLRSPAGRRWLFQFSFRWGTDNDIRAWAILLLAILISVLTYCGWLWLGDDQTINTDQLYLYQDDTERELLKDYNTKQNGIPPTQVIPTKNKTSTIRTLIGDIWIDIVVILIIGSLLYRAFAWRDEIADAWESAKDRMLAGRSNEKDLADVKPAPSPQIPTASQGGRNAENTSYRGRSLSFSDYVRYEFIITFISELFNSILHLRR